MLTVREIESIGSSLGELVADLVAKSTAETNARLDALERRHDEALNSFKASMEALPGAILAEIPEPRGVTLEDIDSAVSRHFAANPVPVPKDGASVTASEVLPELKQHVDGSIEDRHSSWALQWERHAQGLIQNTLGTIRQPADGKNADPEEVARAVIKQLNLNGRDDIEKLCKELVISEVGKIEIPEPEKVTDDQVAKAVGDYMSANPLPVPKDGTSVKAEDVMPEIMGHIQKALDAIPIPEDGADATDAQVTKAVTEYLIANPPEKGKDGTSVNMDDVMPPLRAELQKAIDGIPVPKDGVSVTVDDVLPSLLEEMQKAIDQIPRPKDGTSVTVDDVLPTLREEMQKAVDQIPKPKDGESVTVADVMPEIEKALRSMQDEWALDFEKRAHAKLEKAAEQVIESIPRPKDGRDALQLEDFDVSLEGRVLKMVYDDGERRIERCIHLPIPRYRHLWKQGEQYEPADIVTYGGSSWWCLEETKSRPGQNGQWRLCVKRGHDGKPPTVEEIVEEVLKRLRDDE